MSQRNRIMRKGIHLFTGLSLFALTFMLDNLTLLFVILAGSLFAFVSFGFKQFRLLHKTNDHSLGTLFYPLGILSAFILLYRMPVYYFQASLLVLTVSDTAANIFGQIRSGNIYFHPLREEKSLYGVLGFAAATCIIFYIQLPDAAIWEFLVLATLLAIIFEVFSWRGSDNLSIPVGSALFFIVVERHDSDLIYFSALIVVAAIGAWLLYRLRILDKQASAVAFFLAVYFLGVLGFAWAILMISFFVTSVLFTYIRAVRSPKPSASYSRNAWQVLANSIWAIIFSVAWLITGNTLMIYFYISVVAAVTADTWASEIGPLFHRRCFSLYHRRMATSGVNGGISAAGSLAALAGSFFIVWLSQNLFGLIIDFRMAVILTIAGFLASMADSILGAFAESKLEQWLHSHSINNKIEANDIVNALGSLAAPLFFVLGMLMVEIYR
jgi:uncharacterized protein (TIGR00297 family)